MSENKGYGTKISEKLSKDLAMVYPGLKGFSPRNLQYMQQFYETYRDYEISQQPVAKLPWGSNIVLLDNVQAKKRY